MNRAHKVQADKNSVMVSRSYLSVRDTDYTGDMDEWETPQRLVEQLADEFAPGGFDLDPAATNDNHKALKWYTQADDGLAQPWFGKVFLNPPYSATRKWLAKARAEVAAGNAELVVCLVPASVGTRWWREAEPSASLTRISPARITFVPATQSARFDSAFLVYGKLTGRHGTVPKRCAHCKYPFFPAQRNRVTCSEKCRRARSRAHESEPVHAARLALRRADRRTRSLMWPFPRATDD